MVQKSKEYKNLYIDALVEISLNVELETSQLLQIVHVGVDSIQQEGESSDNIL